MLVLIRYFVDVLFHRRGPEELPSSRFLLGVTLLVAFGADFGTLLIDFDAVRAFVLAAVTTVLDLAFVWCVLHAFSLDRRFRQTMTALLGTSVIIDLFLVPVSFWSKTYDPAQSEAVLPWTVLLLFAIWAIDVAGFVLARALERPYALGVAIMLGYALLQASLVGSIIPVMA